MLFRLNVHHEFQLHAIFENHERLPILLVFSASNEELYEVYLLFSLLTRKGIGNKYILYVRAYGVFFKGNQITEERRMEETSII